MIKAQAPNPIEAPISKFQLVWATTSFRATTFVYWSFELQWDLGLELWSFPLRSPKHA